MPDIPRTHGEQVLRIAELESALRAIRGIVDARYHDVTAVSYWNTPSHKLHGVALVVDGVLPREERETS